MAGHKSVPGQSCHVNGTRSDAAYYSRRELLERQRRVFRQLIIIGDPWTQPTAQVNDLMLILDTIAFLLLTGRPGNVDVTRAEIRPM